MLKPSGMGWLTIVIEKDVYLWGYLVRRFKANSSLEKGFQAMCLVQSHANPENGQVHAG